MAGATFLLPLANLSKFSPKDIGTGAEEKTFALPLLIFPFLHSFLVLATNHLHLPVYYCLLVLLLSFSSLPGSVIDPG